MSFDICIYGERVEENKAMNLPRLTSVRLVITKSVYFARRHEPTTWVPNNLGTGA